MGTASENDASNTAWDTRPKSAMDAPRVAAAKDLTEQKRAEDVEADAESVGSSPRKSASRSSSMFVAPRMLIERAS